MYQQANFGGILNTLGPGYQAPTLSTWPLSGDDCRAWSSVTHAALLLLWSLGPPPSALWSLGPPPSGKQRPSHGGQSRASSQSSFEQRPSYGGQDRASSQRLFQVQSWAWLPPAPRGSSLARLGVWRAGLLFWALGRMARGSDLPFLRRYPPPGTPSLADAPVPLPHSVGSPDPRSAVRAGQFEDGISSDEAYYKLWRCLAQSYHALPQRDLGHY